MHTTLKIGCHVSIAESIVKSFERAQKHGFTAFQIFTKNPRSWNVKEFTKEEVSKFQNNQKKYENIPVIAHISYLPNLTSLNPEIYQKSLKSFKIELKKCIALDIPYFIVHCGSYKGGTLEEGMEVFINSIMKGLEITRGKTKILIENSAGGRNSFGGSFKNLEYILAEVNDFKNVQTCFDTAHGFAAGYDLRTKRSTDNVLNMLDSTVGIGNIPVIHANDSIGKLNSHLDRHEHIGLGEIGRLGFQTLINNDEFQNKIWILETPINDTRNDEENISYLINLMKRKRN